MTVSCTTRSRFRCFAGRSLVAASLLLVATATVARAQQSPPEKAAVTPPSSAPPAKPAPKEPPKDIIAPADNLIVEGIPTIPKALAERVRRYTEFRGAGFADWHPTKREILIGTRFADVAQIHRVLMPGGARTQLTFFPDRIGDATYQPITGDYFIFSKDIGGGEWFQLYRYDVKDGEVTLLTDGSSRNTGGRFSHKGDLLAYMSTRRTRKDTDLYIIDPKNPKSDHLALQLEGGGWNALDWSWDDKRIMLTEELSANESYLYLFDVATGQKTPFTEKGGAEKIKYEQVRFAANGKGVYVTTDRESEFLRLAYVDLATKQHTYLTKDIPWDVESFDLSHDGKTLVFATNENGMSKLYALTTATGKYRPLPGVPTGVIGGVTLRRGAPEVGFTLSSARANSDAYSLNLQSGKLERWTQSETGGLNTANFSEPKLVRWKSFDGKEITGFLYLPPPSFTGKRPVVVNIHGGPEAQFRPTFLGRNNYYLNELGVALLFPNVRGSSGYGKTFLKLDDGWKREDSYKDAEALYKWIKTQPELDGDRILVTGGSYGGHMTLVSATHHADLIRCSIAVVGMSNLVTFLERTEGYRRDLRRVEYGDERDPKMRDFLTRIAPLTLAGKISKPLFVVQGQNDPRVPASEAEQIIRTARGRGTPVWYLNAKDEGHGFAKKKNQDFQFYSTILFMQEYLLK